MARDLSRFTKLGNYLFDQDRFLDFCDEQPDGCILWTGGRHRQGYGMFSGWKIGNDKRIMQVAHRVSMMFKLRRELARDENVIHLCSNNLCVNPAHLEVGTAYRRSEVMVEKGHTWHHHKKNLAPAKQLGRKYKWTEEEILFARANDARTVARHFGISRQNASKMKYECKQLYKWLV